MQFVIVTKDDVYRNAYNQVIKYDSMEKAKDNLQDFHWSWKARIEEYNPAIHKDLKSKIEIGD